MSFQLSNLADGISTKNTAYAKGILPGNGEEPVDYSMNRFDVADINRKKASRVSNRNPIDPQYVLPSYEPLPQLEHKFIRDSIAISDISGSAPRSLPHHIPRPDTAKPIDGSQSKPHTRERFIHATDAPAPHSEFNSSVAASLYDSRFPSVASTLPDSLSLQPTAPYQHTRAHTFMHMCGQRGRTQVHVIGSHRISSKKPLAGVGVRVRVPPVAGNVAASLTTLTDEPQRRRGLGRVRGEHRAVQDRVGALLLQSEVVDDSPQAAATGSVSLPRHGRSSEARWGGEAVAELIGDANMSRATAGVPPVSSGPPAAEPGLLARLARGETLARPLPHTHSTAQGPQRPPSPSSGVRHPETCLPAGKSSAAAGAATATGAVMLLVDGGGGRAQGLVQRRYVADAGAIEAGEEAALERVRAHWAPHEWQARTGRPRTATTRSHQTPAARPHTGTATAEARPAPPAYLSKTRLHAHSLFGPGAHRPRPFQYNTDPNTREHAELGRSSLRAVTAGEGERGSGAAGSDTEVREEQQQQQPSEQLEPLFASSGATAGPLWSRTERHTAAARKAMQKQYLQAQVQAGAGDTAVTTAPATRFTRRRVHTAPATRPARPPSRWDPAATARADAAEAHSLVAALPAY